MTTRYRTEMAGVIRLVDRLQLAAESTLLLRYGLSTAAVALACAARYLLAGELRGEPFMLFFPAILFDAYAFGQSAGIYATILSAALADLLYIGQPDQFDVPDLATAVALVLFIAIGGLASWLLQALRRMNVTLERRVAERTRELRQSNERLRMEAAERRRAEDALLHAQRLEAIGRMAGIVAHDFNNVMTAVLGNIDLLKTRVARHMESDERALRLLSEAELAGMKGERMAQELLAFARKQHLDPKLLEINGVLKELDDLLRKSAGPDVTLRYELGADLDAAFADRDHLERALLNLVINARDAVSERDDMAGEITLATANETLDAAPAEAAGVSPGRYVRIEVRDNGAGIPAGALAHIFEPFFTTKSKEKGTGLGLAQVYGFVRQSNGTVEVDSTEGKGTAVILRLPAAPTPG